MSQQFDAIYENGILRPITPLNLPEWAEVTGVLQEKNGTDGTPTRADKLLGLMADEPDLLDEVVNEAMLGRESHPFRANR
ncbi:MAG: antitoxin family protein [Pirellulales bacterium]